MYRSGGVGLHRKAREQLDPRGSSVEALLNVGAAEQLGPTLEEIEIKVLLEAVSLRYGYDFREYSLAPLRRSINSGMVGEGVGTISAYQDRLLHDRTSMQR